MDDVLEVSASEFKARCLAIFKDLEARRVSRVLVTRRGRPIAELTPQGPSCPRSGARTAARSHRGRFDGACRRRAARRGGRGPPSLMLLLDTRALLLLDSGAPMTRESLAAIDDAAKRGEVLVSPVSAWEIRLLVQKGRIRLDLEPLPWVERFLGLPGVRLTPLGVAAAVSSSLLHEPFQGDRADRLLVASAHTLPATLITREARILSYAEAGHLRALAC